MRRRNVRVGLNTRKGDIDMEEYEVHEIYDTYSGEPLSVDNYESYEDSVKIYYEIMARSTTIPNL